METAIGIISIILLFASFVCLILGLISPQIFSKLFKKNVNRKKTSLIFGSVLIVCIILIGVLSAGTPNLAKMKTPTNQKNITVSGNTSYKNSAIKIYLNGEIAKELKADNKGSFSTSIELKEGLNEIKASATNDKSKTKIGSKTEVIYDITPPDFSFDQPQSPTESNKFTLKGKSEKDARIIILSGSKESGATKVAKDSFELKNIALAVGENKFVISATDQAGNTATKELSVVYRPKETTKSETVQPEATKPTENKVETDEEKAKREEAEAEKQKVINERKNFDTKRGNNAEAASTAQGYITIMKEIGKTDCDMYLELGASQDAENAFVNGGDLKAYRDNVYSARLMVVIDNAVWLYLPDSTKKDLVVTWVNGLQQLYPKESPSVIVSNNIRTVATGSWSIWNGEAKVELK